MSRTTSRNPGRKNGGELTRGSSGIGVLIEDPCEKGGEIFKEGAMISDPVDDADPVIALSPEPMRDTPGPEEMPPPLQPAARKSGLTKLLDAATTMVGQLFLDGGSPQLHRQFMALKEAVIHGLRPHPRVPDRRCQIEERFEALLDDGFRGGRAFTDETALDAAIQSALGESIAVGGGVPREWISAVDPDSQLRELRAATGQEFTFTPARTALDAHGNPVFLTDPCARDGDQGDAIQFGGTGRDGLRGGDGTAPPAAPKTRVVWDAQLNTIGFFAEKETLPESGADDVVLTVRPTYQRRPVASDVFTAQADTGTVLSTKSLDEDAKISPKRMFRIRLEQGESILSAIFLPYEEDLFSPDTAKQVVTITEAIVTIGIRLLLDAAARRVQNTGTSSGAGASAKASLAEIIQSEEFRRIFEERTKMAYSELFVKLLGDDLFTLYFFTATFSWPRADQTPMVTSKMTTTLPGSAATSFTDRPQYEQSRGVRRLNQRSTFLQVPTREYSINKEGKQVAEQGQWKFDHEFFGTPGRAPVSDLGE